jgi:hypothetical protein
MKGLAGHDGPDQPLGVELGNRACLRHDVPISKIGGKIRGAIENALEGVVGLHLSPRCCAGGGVVAFTFSFIVTNMPSFGGQDCMLFQALRV